MSKTQNSPPVATPIVILLPAYNEAQNIAPLLDRIAQNLQNLNYHIIVVDDGSSDETPEIVREKSAHLLLTLLKHQTNLGLGHALKTGIEHSCANFPENSLLITMDADGTHDPALVKNMLPRFAEGFDIIIASRFVPGGEQVGVPFSRRLLSRGAKLLLRLTFPLPQVSDYTSGYRAYRLSLLKKALEVSHPLIESAGFTVMPELLIKLSRLHPRCYEIPLPLRYDLKKGPSKARLLKTILQYLRLILQLKIKR